MKSLEDQIREVAAAGKLRGLTLFKTTDGFQGNATADGIGWRCEVGADPIDVLQRALGGDFDVSDLEDMLS